MKLHNLIRSIIITAIAILATISVSAENLYKTTANSALDSTLSTKDESKTDYQTYSCTIDGIERTYKLYLPANIQPNTPNTGDKLPNYPWNPNGPWGPVVWCTTNTQYIN